MSNKNEAYSRKGKKSGIQPDIIYIPEYIYRIPDTILLRWDQLGNFLHAVSVFVASPVSGFSYHYGNKWLCMTYALIVGVSAGMRTTYCVKCLPRPTTQAHVTNSRVLQTVYSLPFCRCGANIKVVVGNGFLGGHRRGGIAIRR